MDLAETRGVEPEVILEEMVQTYGSAIAVGVDLKDGMVAVKGWTETSGLSGMDFCRSLQSLGVKTVICTDIARDGAMAGANRALYRELQEGRAA